MGTTHEYFGNEMTEISRSAFVPPTLTYSLTGETPEQITQAFLRGWVTSPKDLALTKKALGKATSKWFSAAQLAVPDGLLTAIARGDSLDVTGDGFAASLKVYRGEGSPVKQPDGASYRSWFFDLEIMPK